jgi:predicted amidohydrolase YtcJ
MFIQDGKIIAVGSNEEISPYFPQADTVIDAKQRRVIPGLVDSHLHVIRGGLNYNLELRWDGVTSIADALELLRIQVRNTPPPQWVRVVGGFNEFQFKEKRLPTLREINAIAPETPVFILHLYDRALLNKAALRAVGYTRNTPTPPGSHIERDKTGEPTGLLVANPNAFLLYKTLSLGPKLSHDDQLNSSRHFMRELNRLGVTSVIDAGGGFQNYPEDYVVVEELQRRGQLSLRIAYNLFTQNPGREHEDFSRWISSASPGGGDSFYKLNGAGEMLVYSAADFEDFRVARPDMPQSMEQQLEAVVGLLARNNWPFRMHATYDETIARVLTVLEGVNREVPLASMRWFLDHCETISERNLMRLKALGGGISVQHRMAFQGEYFVERYGAAAARRTPPIRRMRELGIPVGAGTDGTRVASYNPWVAFSWLVSGKTVGGMQLYGDDNLLEREEALRMLTVDAAYFSRDEGAKGVLAPGRFADFAILDRDCMTAAEEALKTTQSLLTVVDGRVCYAGDDYRQFSPPPLPVSPSWSPVAFQKFDEKLTRLAAARCDGMSHFGCGSLSVDDSALGCGCFVF